jgi:invasion protein IalB
MGAAGRQTGAAMQAMAGANGAAARTNGVWLRDVRLRVAAVRRRSVPLRQLTAFVRQAGVVAGLVAGLLGAAVVSSAPATAQGVVRSSHGDWQMRCETPPGARAEQCALVQNVAADDQPTISLLVIVLKTADGQNRLLRVVAPLGVLLPAGLGLKIDDKDIGRAGFVRCLNTGCIAEVVMDETLVNGLKTGKSAIFIVFQTPEEGVGIPISLAGFGEGLEKLP